MPALARLTARSPGAISRRHGSGPGARCRHGRGQDLAAARTSRFVDAGEGIVRAQDHARPARRRVPSASIRRGCLAGAVALPINGATWQVMRLSRNRNWGHPKLIAFLERLADKAKKIGWNGLLVGDMSQPRGGPMLTGHTSHQVGLDADIWFTPMPIASFPAKSGNSCRPRHGGEGRPARRRPEVWTHARTELIRVAAEDPEVERIFVNAAIKKALCREAGSDRDWLAKVRPWSRARLSFPRPDILSADSPQCKPQPPPESGEGCGHELDPGSRMQCCIRRRRPPSRRSRPGLTLANFPPACRPVLMAP